MPWFDAHILLLSAENAHTATDAAKCAVSIHRAVFASALTCPVGSFFNYWQPALLPKQEYFSQPHYSHRRCTKK